MRRSRTEWRFKRDCFLIAAFVFILILYLYSSYSLFLSAPPIQTAESLSSDVTLVTHLSVERISALEKIFARWEGPIAVAFWLKNLDDVSKIESLEMRLQQHTEYFDSIFVRLQRTSLALL